MTVSIKECSIFTGYDLFLDKKKFLSCIKGTQVFIITDENSAPHYLSTIKNIFSDFQCDTLILPPGEQHKTLSSFEKIINTAAEHHHHRDTTFIALGGGVIGDMTGFAAACYHRGVAWINIPTTLLAQVDASIGGKTAVNHPTGKNLIGAFYQPKAVFIDIKTLDTLPDREFRTGISEIIKAALIKDAEFFTWLENNLPKLLTRDPKTLLFAIQKSCDIKRTIVMQDEKENNVRALLNFGHTFAHAIEHVLGFGTWLHGEAVAFGIVAAATLSHQLRLLKTIDYNRIHKLFTRYDLLKTLPQNISLTDLTDTMQSDKKVKANHLRFIVLTTIGSAVITDQVSMEMIMNAWSCASKG